MSSLASRSAGMWLWTKVGWVIVALIVLSLLLIRFNTFKSSSGEAALLTFPR